MLTILPVRVPLHLPAKLHNFEARWWLFQSLLNNATLRLNIWKACTPERVLFTDVTDVVLNMDPFGFMKKMSKHHDLFVGLEREGLVPRPRGEWTRDCMDSCWASTSQSLDMTGHQTINGGVMGGKLLAVKDFVDAFVQEASLIVEDHVQNGAHQACLEKTFDQALMNRLVYTKTWTEEFCFDIYNRSQPHSEAKGQHTRHCVWRVEPMWNFSARLWAGEPFTSPYWSLAHSPNPFFILHKSGDNIAKSGDEDEAPSWDLNTETGLLGTIALKNFFLHRSQYIVITDNEPKNYSGMLEWKHSGPKTLLSPDQEQVIKTSDDVFSKVIDATAQLVDHL